MRFLIYTTLSIFLIANVFGNHQHFPKPGSNPQNLQRGSGWRQGWRISSQYQNYDDDLGGLGEQHPTQLFDDVGDETQQHIDTEFEDFERVIPPKHFQTTTSIPALTSPVKLISGQPEIDTPKGKIRGKRISLESNGKIIFAFLGIPFAKSPTGELRFKPPVAAEKFETTYDATNLPNACVQDNFEFFNGFAGEVKWNANTNMTEDCLYINLWVPEDVVNKKDQELASVLFWIYGGGFYSGSSSLDIYQGAHLAGQENVVVVSSQYRVGPLGFLYFGNKEVPGNVGFLDQNLALIWTHEVIESFGGNPDSITLFGESAGSVSVSYHLMSPASKSYFKRAVMMSAVPTSTPYGISHPNIQRHRSLKLAKLAGCDIQNSMSEIIACLRTKDASNLTALQWQITENKLLQFAFLPTVDGTFINDFPANLINKGEAKRADLMIGSVDNEGTYFLLYQYLKYFHHDKPSFVSRDRFVEIMRDMFSDFSELEQSAIINHYTNWENPEDGYLNQQLLGDAIGDAYFVCPNRQFADAWSNRGLKVFYYHFTQRSSLNPWAKWLGVMHGEDDIQYMFGHPLNTSKTYPTSEKQLSILMMRLLGNFARNGTPSENWERYTSETPIYLDLNATNPSDFSTSNKFGPRADHCAFWNKLLPQLKPVERRQGQSRSEWWKHQQPLHQKYEHFGQPSGQHCTQRGIHGGNSFHHVEEIDHNNNCHQMSLPPIAPGVPKHFGQNSNRRNNAQNAGCQKCCDNSHPVSSTSGQIPV